MMKSIQIIVHYMSRFLSTQGAPKTRCCIAIFFWINHRVSLHHPTESRVSLHHPYRIPATMGSHIMLLMIWTNKINITWRRMTDSVDSPAMNQEYGDMNGFDDIIHIHP